MAKKELPGKAQVWPPPKTHPSSSLNSRALERLTDGARIGGELVLLLLFRSAAQYSRCRGSTIII